MTRYSKTSSGKYQIKGSTYPKLVGSRAQVWHGNAYKTTGDLTKLHLFKNKSGRVVSRKKHKTASKEKRLVKHGYGARKGKFGAVRLGTNRRRRKRRGGMSALSPASVSGMGNNSMSTDDLQLEAGMSGGRRRRRRSSKRRSSKRRSSKRRKGGRKSRRSRKRSSRGGKRRRRRRRGGMSALNPSSVSGMADNSMSTDDLQLEAGMSGGRRRRRSSRRHTRRHGGRRRRRSTKHTRRHGGRRRRRSTKRRRHGGKRHRRSTKRRRYGGKRHRRSSKRHTR